MERKLAAIVAADVANYSMLLGQNEIGTLTELNRLQDEVFAPAITQYRGHVVRLMGDGSLISFDSALNAVKFAFDVQHCMSERKARSPSDIPIAYRIGANLGDIVHDKNDIHGEGINVAVRLEELAPPGGICLSHSIYMQTKNAIGVDFLPIGERHLKHIADPVPVWRWKPGKAPESAIAKPAHALPRYVHGRQILDPEVTSVLIDLHMRSAKLALSEAFDQMLASHGCGCDLSLPELHEIISEKLSAASDILFPIAVERSERHSRLRQRRANAPQSMATYLSDALDGGNMFFALTMLQRIQAILRSGETQIEKRSAFMQVAREMLRESMLPEIKDSIRFAFLDA